MKGRDVQLREAVAEDLIAILAIYNHAVEHTTAVWSETPATLEERHDWLAAKHARGFPVLVAVENAKVLGFATYGDFRPWPGYARSIEHSVYVDPACHRRGTGRALMGALIDHARATGYHTMIAGIDAGNTASMALHVALGFVEAGRLPQVGRKFGRWLDLALMQLMLGQAGCNL